MPYIIVFVLKVQRIVQSVNSSSDEPDHRCSTLQTSEFLGLITLSCILTPPSCFMSDFQSNECNIAILAQFTYVPSELQNHDLAFFFFLQ